MPIDPSIPLGVKPPAFNSPFEMLGQMQALQQQRQVIQSNQALEESRRQDIEKQRRLEAAQQKFYNIIGTSKTPDEVEARIKTEAPEMLAGYQKQRMELDEKAAGIKEKGLQASKLIAEIQAKGKEYSEPFMQLVEKSGHKPEVFDFALNTIQSHFPDFPADQYRQQAQGDPAKIKAIVDSLKSPEQQRADASAVTSAAELPGKVAESATRQQVLAGMRGGLTPDQLRQQAQSATTATETARHNRMEEGLAAQRIGQEDTAISLTPDAKKMVAHQFAMTGQLPPMGMGKAGAAVRTSIINEAANIYKGLDLPSQQAAYKANKDSLVKMQGQRDAVGAFEETALKNLDQFLGTAKKAVDTKSPWLNKPLRSLSGAVLGSVDQAAFNAARQAVIPEFAKLLSNPSLSGQLTDSQRKEVDTILSPDATLGQIYAAANVLKQDAANRKTALDDGIKAIQERIAKPPAGVATPDAGDVIEFVRDPKTGKLVRKGR